MCSFIMCSFIMSPDKHQPCCNNPSDRHHPLGYQDCSSGRLQLYTSPMICSTVHGTGMHQKHPRHIHCHSPQLCLADFHQVGVAAEVKGAVAKMVAGL